VVPPRRWPQSPSTSRTPTFISLFCVSRVRGWSAHDRIQPCPHRGSYTPPLSSCLANREQSELTGYDMFVIPVPFAKHHKDMLVDSKELLEYRNGYVSMHPKHNKLITSLKTTTPFVYQAFAECVKLVDAP